MQCVKITSTKNGGDISVGKFGIEAGDYLETAVFCALFGGNREENTRDSYARSEENKSWWGNSFVERQYNSETERAINDNTANEPGLANIKQAVFNDLRRLLRDGHIEKITDVRVWLKDSKTREIGIDIYLVVLGVYRSFKFISGGQ